MDGAGPDGEPIPGFHHARLPEYSTLLTGPRPRDGVGWQAERLQIWYNNTAEGWADPEPHYHRESEECFIVLRGTIIVEVEGQRRAVGPGEFCCFAPGVWHAVVAVQPPVESLMIRTPTGDDKVYAEGRPRDGG
jgi:mannose-6-phosphate isomerase-like protein (cupin superfamily)